MSDVDWNSIDAPAIPFEDVVLGFDIDNKRVSCGIVTESGAFCSTGWYEFPDVSIEQKFGLIASAVTKLADRCHFGWKVHIRAVGVEYVPMAPKMSDHAQEVINSLGACVIAGLSSRLSHEVKWNRMVSGTWKNHAFGHGRMEKEEVIEAAHSKWPDLPRLPIHSDGTYVRGPKKGQPKNVKLNDCYDALGVAEDTRLSLQA